MNIELYFGKTSEDLDELTTRHLLAILKNSRCWGGNSYCQDFEDLENRVRGILSTREHIARDTRQVPIKEKKQMKWARK